MTIDRYARAGAALLLLFASWAHADEAFNDIYIFGDSLSDTGNAALVLGDLPFPFFENRISNGPVAVEILAARLGLDANASRHVLFEPEAGGNYAVAGAKVVGGEAQDLPFQLFAFFANNGYVARADALYVIVIGGNDLRDARSELNPLVARGIVAATAGGVRATIEALAQAGARKFLIANAPDISLIPETGFVALEKGDPGIFERARRVSEQYRFAIRKVAKHFDDDDDIEVAVFDLFGFLNRVLRNADALGFSNTTEPCFFTSLFVFSPACELGANFDAFLFFDEIHPTARAHSIVGEAMYDEVADAFDLDDDDGGEDGDDDDDHDD